MNRWLHGFALTCALTLGVAGVAAAPDIQKLGPQVGERVPDFTLTDQHGVQRSLSSLLGDKGLMLVFYRSADW